MWVANEFDLDVPAIEKAIKEMHPERLQEISQEFDERYFELQQKKGTKKGDRFIYSTVPLV